MRKDVFWARLTRWVHGHLLFAILVLGFLLRFICIESRSLQYDDAFSIFLSIRSLQDIIMGTAADTMPPLYYFLLHFWMMISKEIWFIRLLSVLISLVLVALLYWVVERWSDRSTAGWAALLAAISPLQIYHGQDIRMYALLVLGQMGYICFFTRIWFARQEQTKQWGNWIGLILSGLVATYSHNLAVFALVVPNLFLLIRKQWKMLGQLLAAQVVIGLGTLPWWMLLPGQLAKIQHAFWTPRPGIVEIIQAIIMFTAAMPLPRILIIIAAVLSFQILIMIIIELWRIGRRGNGIVDLLGALFLIPPVLLFAVSYIMRPVFVPRGFLVSSLAYYGLAGYVITHSWLRGPGKIITGAFLLAAALTLPSFYTFNSFPRSPYREAAAYLEQVIQPGAVIVHDSKLSYFPMHFYAPDLPQVFVADSPGSENDTFAPASQQAMQLIAEPDLPTAVRDRQNLFFITYSRVFQEYKDIGIVEHPSLQWLNKNYRQAGHRVFNDLEILQFERK